MRLPFPERIPLAPVFFAATILAGLQQLQGTSIVFTIFSYLFIVIATITFNIAGGFTKTTGSYVFFYSLLGVIIGLVYKAYLGEAADSNLHSPNLTMAVFTGGITAMLLAVVISKKITRKVPLLQTVLKDKDMKNAAIGCFAVGFTLAMFSSFFPHGSGTFLSAIAQLNRFIPMATIIATLHCIKRSGGRRSVDWLVILTIAAGVIFGFLSFSKEGMFAPVFCWLVAAASLRKDFRPYQIAIGLFVVYLMGHYLVPYSQYGRDQVPEDDSLANRVKLAVSLLSNLEQVRETYLAEIEPMEDLDNKGYYNSPQGFFDRLTMIGPDDALINYTSQGNYEGYSVLAAYFANWIPHFIWPNKPILYTGNLYARQIGGIVAEDDFGTGISFTPTGEAYHLAGWTGVFVLAPIIWIMLFTVMDGICGDVRNSPWGLLVIPMYAHGAPEGMLGSPIYMVWFGTLAVVFVAFGTAQVMPIVGTLLAGPEKVGLARIRRATPSSPRPSRRRSTTTTPELPA